jgi:hypothetical protein
MSIALIVGGRGMGKSGIDHYRVRGVLILHRLSPTPTGSPVPLGARPASVVRWVNIADREIR